MVGTAQLRLCPPYVLIQPHAIARCGSNSAIWIALSAAPFRSWSADTNIEIEWPLGIAEILADAADENVILA